MKERWYRYRNIPAGKHQVTDRTMPSGSRLSQEGDADTEIFQQGDIRSQIKLCLQEVGYHRKVTPIQKYSSRETSGHR